MSRRVVVHVGQMKSGTTFVQQTLTRNRDRLLERGVLYPGPKSNQQHACYGLCGSDIYWVHDRERWEAAGAELVEAIEAHRGTVLISAEALSCMSADGIERFAQQIGGFDGVVVTVRNMLSTLLSAWQQGVKRGAEMSLDQFFDRMQHDRGTQSGLWRNYAFGNTVRWWSRWAETTVIAVESFGRNELVDAVLTAAGVHDVELTYPKLSARDSNISLRWEDVELLRALNRATNHRSRDHADDFRGFLLEQLLFPATQVGSGSKIRFPRQHVETGSTWAREEIAKFPSTAKRLGDIEALASAKGISTASGPTPEVDIADRVEELMYLWFERSRTEPRRGSASPAGPTP